ncbi:MAG: alpha/beta fold hydrolase [Armatimonadota bacterium]
MKIPYKGLAIIGAAAAGTAVANSIVSNRAGSLENSIGGHERTYRWRMGDIFYTVSGEGEPLLLVHGIGAGASSFEWRKNFLPLSKDFTVYALDMLGFGMSDRPNIPYRSEVYTQLILDFIMDVIGRPTDIAASSHGAAYSVLAANSHRLMIKRLLLSCPTGIGVADRKVPFSLALSTGLNIPVFGKSVYLGLTSINGIEYYLKTQIYADPDNATPEVIGHYYKSSHQPGAERPIRAFISGALNTNIHDRFSALTQPVALVWGKQAKITPVDVAERFTKANPQASLHVFDQAAQLPHEEKADEYNQLARDVFSSPPEGVTTPPHAHTAP